MPDTICLMTASTLALLLGAGAAQAALVVSTDATSNVTCSAGVCTATAPDAVLNVTDLANLIASSPVTIQSGSEAQDIVFNAPFSWTSANGLTLDAYRAIKVQKSVSDAGPAPLTLTTSDGGKNGKLRFASGGNIAFLSNSNKLSINKQAYQLINSIVLLKDAVGKNPSGKYALSASYDASVDGVYSSPPIEPSFLGIFEALGNSILNMSITDHTSGESVGLFSHVANGGSVENLKLVKANVFGTAPATVQIIQYVGALAGESEGKLFGDTVTGNVTGKKGAYVGGLVGYASGEINDSKSAANVSGGHFAFVGGILGNAFQPQGEHTVVDNCVATGNIDVSEGVFQKRKFLVGVAGGLVGGAINIRSSRASGNVTGGNHVVLGGLAGIAFHVSESYASGKVRALDNAFVGGLVGEHVFEKMENSYALGSVRAKSHSDVGGLVGLVQGKQIGLSYSIGAVSGAKQSTVGGLIGSGGQAGVFVQDDWDIDTSKTDQGTGSGNETGITGLTDAQLKSGLPAGFDPAVWAENPNINNGYPYLIANPPPK